MFIVDLDTDAVLAELPNLGSLLHRVQDQLTTTEKAFFGLSDTEPEDSVSDSMIVKRTSAISTLRRLQTLIQTDQRAHLSFQLVAMITGQKQPSVGAGSISGAVSNEMVTISVENDKPIVRSQSKSGSAPQERQLSSGERITFDDGTSVMAEAIDQTRNSLDAIDNAIIKLVVAGSCEAVIVHSA